MSTNLAGPGGEPEYLSFHDGPRAGRRGRRAALVGGGLLAAGALAVGGWAVNSFLAGGGTAAASAVPASAVAYVSVDLDPSAGQKIEAIRILNKFPALRDELGLDSRDDLRRWLFDRIREGGCSELDYGTDVEPWIGDRLAVAAVADEEKGALPMVALQVADQEAAAAAVTRLSACIGDAATERTGVAFAGDYMVLAETQGQADRFAAAAEEKALADDPGFQEWTKAVGDPGIVTMYLSARAPGAFAEMGERPRGAWSDYAPGVAAPGAALLPEDRLDTLAETFEGMAAVLRFRDGGIEAEVVGRGLDGVSEGFEGVSPGPIAELPESTAAAISAGFPDGWLQTYLDTMAERLGQDAVDRLLAEGEAATGLDLPEDVETLLGDGTALVVDSSLDLAAGPDRLPVGLLVHGDAARVSDVVDKLRPALGPAADMLEVSGRDDAVAIGLDPGYVGRLLDGGRLGSTAAFTATVPEADRAAAVVYVDFDAGDWAQRLVGSVSGDDPDAGRNVAPLRAFGVSGWVDDGVTHAILRVTTD